MTFVVRIAFNSEVNIERISNDDKIITVALASHVMTCNVPFLLWVPYITLSYFIFSKIQRNVIPQEAQRSSIICSRFQHVTEPELESVSYFADLLLF